MKTKAKVTGKKVHVSIMVTSEIYMSTPLYHCTHHNYAVGISKFHCVLIVEKSHLY